MIHAPENPVGAEPLNLLSFSSLLSSALLNSSSAKTLSRITCTRIPAPVSQFRSISRDSNSRPVLWTRLERFLDVWLRIQSAGIPGWRSGLAPAFGPERDPGDPGSNPTSGFRCMEPASPSACVSASLSLSHTHTLSVTIVNK